MGVDIARSVRKRVVCMGGKVVVSHLGQMAQSHADDGALSAGTLSPRGMTRFRAMACVFSHLVSTSSIVSALALPARGRDVTSNDGSDDAAFARGLSAASIFVPEGFDTFEAMMLLECSGNNMV